MTLRSTILILTATLLTLPALPASKVALLVGISDCRFQIEVQRWRRNLIVVSGIIVKFAPWVEEEASSAEEQLASNRLIRHAEIVETTRGCHAQPRFYNFRRRLWLKKT